MLNNITKDFIKKKYFDTLSNISFDDSNQVSLFESNKKYVNFDIVIKDFFSDKLLSSCDLLICKNHKIYLIEFKNSTKVKLNKHKIELKQKASESWMIIIKLLFEYNISLDKFLKKYKLILVIIYKTSENNTNSRNKINKHIAEKESIYFGLERYKDFYSEIITTDKKTFLEKYDYFDWKK
ncbi:MAG: hypothetical protein QM487_07810 [Candidatus Marithrix sp.]